MAKWNQYERAQHRSESRKFIRKLGEMEVIASKIQLDQNRSRS
jgi:hypothetical protein